jgi:hypothetical protein
MTVLITKRTGETQVLANIREISQGDREIELSAYRSREGVLSSEDLTLDQFDILKIEAFLK